MKAAPREIACALRVSGELTPTKGLYEEYRIFQQQRGRW